MGSTFVSLDGRGFWARDGALELWLRLLALHLPEPGDAERADSPIPRIRDGWLLASKGYFVGCIPVGLDQAVAIGGKDALIAATRSLLDALRSGPPTLDAGVLNLLGQVDGWFVGDLETAKIIELGGAFLDLIEQGVGQSAADAECLPRP